MNPEDMDQDFVVDLTEQEPAKKPQSNDPKRFCIPDGDYVVSVVDVNKETSKAGNPMFVSVKPSRPLALGKQASRSSSPRRRPLDVVVSLLF